MKADNVDIAWQDSLSEIVKTEHGIRFIMSIMLKIGYFSYSFTTGASIYKNTALSDLGKWIEKELDNIDLNIMLKIKRELGNLKISETNKIDTKGDVDAEY